MSLEIKGLIAGLIVALLVLGAVFGLSAIINHEPSHHDKVVQDMSSKMADMSNKMPAKHTTLSCPITGTKISSVKAAAGHETYKGKTYYFCCPECKPRFDKDRDLAIKHASQGKYEKM